jgi:tetratricopeptide (TPR) repeat protein
MRLRTLALVLAAAASVSVESAPSQANQNARGIVLSNVNEALAESESGRFAQARARLERSLAQCDAGPEGRECRILYASGLGSLLYRQGTVDRKDQDSLFGGAVAYYDRILTEAPDNSEAVYGKALSYRALGPHEWMEPFFRKAPTLDPGRRGLYLTFLGDYYGAGKRWSEAIKAYEPAVQQDADDDGARAGLVDALAAQGPKAARQLLLYARDWEVRYPGSAADAYRAILMASFAPEGRRDALADTAVVGLVRTQARNRLTPGEMPPDVSNDWTPVRELHTFLSTTRPDAAPWWTQGTERREALAQAELAQGRVALSNGDYDIAELEWTRGAALPPRSSPVTLDLQRELALLYFRQPSLDPGGRKFQELEDQIFSGKGGALATGDLEAAQRFHTTLGLIYAERGVWRGDSYIRNARQQLTWALEKADRRERAERFYQPLPELRALLARGLDSLGDSPGAARRYAEAAAAFLDTDDLAASDGAVRSAVRLGEKASGPVRVLALRSDLARGEATAAEACTAERIATIRGDGPPAFFDRQRFKVLADCVKAGSPSDRRRSAIAAFRLVDSAGITLVGGDVARFERVMLTLLAPFGVTFQTAHLNPEPASGGHSITVYLPGETRPVWHTTALDDVIAARVVAELGSTTAPFPIAVVAGVLRVPATAGISPDRLQQLKKVAGVREVRTQGY